MGQNKEQKEPANQTIKATFSVYERLGAEIKAQEAVVRRNVSASRALENLFAELDQLRAAHEGRPIVLPSPETTAWPAETRRFHEMLEVILADPAEAGPCMRNLEATSKDIKRRARESRKHA